jgi:acetylornithine/N-succinyldiaminopimelate aminotransferase
MFVRGDGSYLYDEQGRQYLDFVQGWAVNSLGHSPLIVRSALSEQATKVVNISPAYYNEPMCRLANLLASLSGLDRVFFANSGAEANEGAIKLARKWGAVKRDRAFEIVVFEGAFHGRTLATMSASGKAQWKDLYEPKLPGFVRIRMNDFAALARVISARTVAVMLEPIQGDSGVVDFSLEFLRNLRKLTQERNILLMFDEVQTGIGRTGRMFAFEHADVQPDVLTLGKGIGGGVPLAAVLARQDLCLFEPGDQGGTFNGNPLMTAVGYAVVKAISNAEFLKEVRENGAYLTSQLQGLSRELNLGEVRGRGLLCALELRGETGSAIVDAALTRYLLLNSPHPSALRFMPALTVTPREIDEMIWKLRAAIQVVAG